MDSSINWWQNLFFHLIKKFGGTLILISLVLGLGAGLTYKIVSAPKYVATSQMSQNDNNYSIISSYSQFISTNKFKSSLGESVSKTKWKDMDYTVKLTNSANSPFFDVNTESKNPDFSKFLASETIKLLMSEIGSYLSGTNMSQVSKPIVKQQKVSFSKMLKLSMAVFAGCLFISTILVSLFERFVGNVKTQKYLYEVVGIPDFGMIDLKRSNNE